MKSFLLLLALAFATATAASAEVEGVQWHERINVTPQWLHSSEARDLAGNLLRYQCPSGGWPKNIDMGRPLSLRQKARLWFRPPTESTIDNGATCTQVRLLARLAVATGDSDYREASLRGIHYLLDAQYPNGGWPQISPLRKGYFSHITFNDDAMINVMALLRDAADRPELFPFVDDTLRLRCRGAVAKGIRCILRCQVVVNDTKTIWGAQHDEHTLAAAPARTFEPVALASYESVGIVQFLMEQPNPPPEVIASIEAAITWFKQNQLHGLRLQEVPAPSLPGGLDRIIVADPAAPPLWARFCEIGTNRPLFSGRDSIIRGSLAEIEPERRIGYRWYVQDPAKLLKNHALWSASRSAKTQ